jgi:hypothetical protein
MCVWVSGMINENRNQKEKKSEAKAIILVFIEELGRREGDQMKITR